MKSGGHGITAGGVQQQERSFQLILSQAAVNQEILQIIADAKTTLTFISMMSQLSDPQLVHALNEAVSRNVNVHVYHSVNPFVHTPGCPSFKFSLTIIPAHGKRLPFILAPLLGGTYVNLTHASVTHTRFIANEAHCLLGGVDFNRICAVNHYVQHAIRISLKCHPLVKQQLEEVVLELSKEGNLHNHSFSSTSSCASRALIIGTSATSTSALETILYMIQQAKYEIWIENQYFEHEEVLSAIAKRQAEFPHGHLKVVLVGNYHFDINPYHPGKHVHIYWCGLCSRIGNFTMRKETMKGIRYLKGQGCQFEFRAYRGKYTHNKIFVIDRGRSFAVGTFNLHMRSLDAGKDCEIGVVMWNDIERNDDRNNNSSVMSDYINSVMKQTEIILSSSTTLVGSILQKTMPRRSLQNKNKHK